MNTEMQEYLEKLDSLREEITLMEGPSHVHMFGYTLRYREPVDDEYRRYLKLQLGENRAKVAIPLIETAYQAHQAVLATLHEQLQLWLANPPGKESESGLLSQEEYVKQGVCPCCRSGRIGLGPGSQISYTASTGARKEMICGACGFEWDDLLQVVGYQVEDRP